MNADQAIELPTENEEEASFDAQLETLYATIEQLEDAIASVSKREQAWAKEKKQLLDTGTKVEKKLGSADEDVKFIKERLDQLKKEKEQTIQTAKKEQDVMSKEIKHLREKNKKLQQNMEKVTHKLDAAITKIGELME